MRLMPYRADLELARHHLREVEELIVRQTARIEQLRRNDQSDVSALRLLDFLTRSRGYLLEFIEQTSKGNE
jgi:hypothetical protein